MNVIELWNEMRLICLNQMLLERPLLMHLYTIGGLMEMRQ